jgi:hypothetical protein
MVENFLLEASVQAGVVKKVEITQAKNPNKWNKHLAPWFNDTCKDSKLLYHKALK